MDIRQLQANQLDALREVANIGAGHAATALSQMTGSRIMISVPQLQIIPLEEVPDSLARADEVVVATLMHMLGDLTGRTLLVFPRDSAIRLAEILLGRPAGSTHVFSELEQSAIKEAGNILSSAYMNALADFMGMMLLPSVPSLVIDLCAAVLTTTHTNFGRMHDYVFSIQTEFSMAGSESLQGFFLLLPDPESLGIILESVRLA
ncbi:MAG: chemotaxis protein CheC [Gemmatimonadota bacterium]|jgi:chemotaxis protein CheC|nr:chemotaxis protein CheC [Gemmatimonadota bacterium]